MIDNSLLWYQASFKKFSAALAFVTMWSLYLLFLRQVLSYCQCDESIRVVWGSVARLNPGYFKFITILTSRRNALKSCLKNALSATLMFTGKRDIKKSLKPVCEVSLQYYILRKLLFFFFRSAFGMNLYI